MWTPILLAVFAFASVMAGDIDESLRCEAMLGDLKDKEDLPKDLDDVCPNALNAIDCYEKLIYANTGLTLEQLAWGMEGKAGEKITVAVNIKNFVKELCDTDSVLRKEYEEDAECFSTVDINGDDDNVPCVEEAAEAIDVYEKIYNSVEQGPSDYNRECMITAYTVACAASSVKEKCGDRAFNTFRKMIKKTTIFKYGVCSEEQMEDLKTFALEHLDVDGDKRDLMQLAFDLKKRRK